MYARDIALEGDAGKKTINLAVSGKLWNRSLVMVDVETKSLWSQLLGRAMSGPLEGAELDRLGSVMTDWKTWRKLHPDTTVMQMSRTARDYSSDLVYQRTEDFIVGMARGDKARAWPFDQLIKQPVVNDQFAGGPVLVLFDPTSYTALVFERRARGQTLTFKAQGESLVDLETGSVWDAQHGKALSGPLSGEQLKAHAAIVSFRNAWKIFHPETEEFSAGG